MNDELGHYLANAYKDDPVGLAEVQALVAQREHDAVRAFVEQGWGPRCETKDTEDFPELKDHPDGRCPACEMWEAYDDFKQLKPQEDSQK